MPDNSPVMFDMDSARRIAELVRDSDRQPKGIGTRVGQFSGSQAPRACIVQAVGPRVTSTRLYPARFVHREVDTTTTSTSTTGSGGTTTTTTTSTSTTQPCKYTLWGTGAQDCWLAYLGEATHEQVYSALVVGVAPDGLPIALVSDFCPATPTTSTTTTACAGYCEFTWTGSAWSQSANTCQTGCLCTPPDFCPPAGYTCDSTIKTRTNCTRRTIPPRDCSATTSTTTTPTGCTGGCQAVWTPEVGWQWKYNYCESSANCRCSIELPSSGGSACGETVTGECVYTPPVCGGTCRWVSNGTSYLLVAIGCYSVGSLPSPCACEPPTDSPGACGSIAVTSCVSESCTECTGSTTTTAGCNGACLYRWEEATTSWLNIRSCGSPCRCSYPGRAGAYDCELLQTSCLNPTTTTTSTSTSTSSTTTTGGPTTTTTSTTTTQNCPNGNECPSCPEGQACYIYQVIGGAWVLIRKDCGGPDPSPPTQSPESWVQQYGENCLFTGCCSGSSTTSTTTTSLPSTSTSTSTSSFTTTTAEA